MARMSNDKRLAADAPHGIAGVHLNAPGKRALSEWSKYSAADPTLDTAGQCRRGHPNPGVYDEKIGLGWLARAALLRDVFKTVLTQRALRSDRDQAWELCVRSQKNYNELFRPDALGEEPSAWIHPSSGAAITLRDPHWREQLCDGAAIRATRRHGERQRERKGEQQKERQGEKQEDRLAVTGLNDWFGNRYKGRLGGGRMTPTLLFETPFFGRDAPERFVHFVCTGEFAPGANSSLLPSDVPPLAEHHRDKCNALVDLIRSGDNKGRPIVSVRCAGAPTVANALAKHLQEQLESLGLAACYISIAKHMGSKRLNDAGFVSIVDAMYAFVIGLHNLDLGAAGRADTMSLEQRIAAIRASLLVNPKIFLFVGYDESGGQYPAIVEFIRDEPLGKLLRLLQHPTLGDRALPPPLSAYNASFFVVIGEAHLSWLTTAQQERVDVLRTRADIDYFLDGHCTPRLHSPVKLRAVLPDTAPLPCEWQLHLLDFLIQHKALDHSANGHKSFEDMLQAAFGHYWQHSLVHWQRVLLGALSLSETGLRSSTILQILDSYSRVIRHGDPTIKGPFTPEQFPFSRFMDSLASEDAPALLMRYHDGADSELTDPFNYPSQAITPLSDLHQWNPNKAQDGSAARTVDFVAPQLRNLVRSLLREDERMLLRRILCELALQAHRIRVRTVTSLSSDPDPRADRSLVEAIFHGLLAVGQCEDWVVVPQHELSIREVPPRPADAFAFVYFVLYRDLLCRGDLTSLGRHYGNGDLELELLLLASNPVEPDLKPGRQSATAQPEEYVRVPKWLERYDAFTERRAGGQHLLAICHAAKRATRLAILKAGLEQLNQRVKRRGSMETQERLELSKLKIDVAVHSFGRGGPERTKARAFLVNEIRAIVQCFGDPKDADRKVANIRGAIRRLRHKVDRYVRLRQASEENQLVPEELIGYIDEARNAMAHTVPLEGLPANAISLLTRLAIVSIHAADVLHDRERERPEKALSLYLASICIFWLAKSVASARMRADPLVQPSRISAHSVEEMVRAAGVIPKLCIELGWKDSGRLLHRIERMVRSTLDTYTREHPRSRADGVMMLIMESTYARLFPSDTIDRLCTSQKKGALTGDYRLDGHMRCMQWLHAAELALLPVSSRPNLRIALCNERISCLVACLDSLCERPPGKARSPNEVLGRAAFPMLEWIARDLRLLDAFIEFLKLHSPGIQREKFVWPEIMREKLELLAGHMRRWQLGSEGTPEWHQAHQNLHDIVNDFGVKFGTQTTGA